MNAKHGYKNSLTEYRLWVDIAYSPLEHRYTYRNTFRDPPISICPRRKMSSSPNTRIVDIGDIFIDSEALANLRRSLNRAEIVPDLSTNSAPMGEFPHRWGFRVVNPEAYQISIAPNGIYSQNRE